MMAVLSVYLVILWYKTPSLRIIVMLAISIGLSMMAKLSGGTVAPAVAALFLLKLIKDREHIGKYILQYLVFGIIVFPPRFPYIRPISIDQPKGSFMRPHWMSVRVL